MKNPMTKKFTKGRPFIISGKFDEYYKTENVDSMTPSDSFDLAASTIDDIYKRYNQLMTQDQSIEKNILGYGTDTKGDKDERLPIYEYIIKAPETTQKTHGEAGKTDLNQTPVLLITTGVHGNEKSAVYGAYEFVKQMIENPQNSQGLHDLKSNFTIRIIPIVNPGGFNRKFRNNLLEVDINRNFSKGWETLEHNAKGKGPYSEREAKIVQEWLAEHNQAFAYVDYHNFTRNGKSIGMPERKDEMTSYHLSPNPKLDQMYSSLIRRLSLSWKEDYLACFSNLGNVAYGFVYSDHGREIPSTISEAYFQQGILLAAIPEITYDDPTHPDEMYTKTVMELSAEFFINYLLTLVDCFKDWQL